MKYSIVVLLAALCLQTFAQQPRLSQVDKYITATGNPTQAPVAPVKRYNLLNTFYREGKSLMLNLPPFDDRGAQEAIPFGYKLNGLSEVIFDNVSGNLAQSTIRSLYNKSVFSGISYLFCDSVVYGITLYYDNRDRTALSSLKEKLDRFFKYADCSLADVYWYSDPDYAVKLSDGKVEVFSLFHYPIEEVFYPGVSHKVWYGPYAYEVNDSSVLLAFYNQESKENNIQSAFKIRYRYSAGKRFGMNKIRFVLDDITYDFPLAIDYIKTADESNRIEEYNTRVFINPEILKKMVRSNKVEVVLEGENGRFSYVMPAFQRASLSIAYEYFRWTVTNPMAKYKAW